MAAELDLACPALPWHGTRDRVAELGDLPGPAHRLAGQDGPRLVAADADRDRRGVGAGRRRARAAPRPCRTSATRWPRPWSLSAATRAPALVATMLAGMVQEHERGLGGWHAEWETLPDLAVLASGALRITLETIRGPRRRPGADAGQPRADPWPDHGRGRADGAGRQARPAAGARPDRARLEARGGRGPAPARTRCSPSPRSQRI